MSNCHRGVPRSGGKNPPADLVAWSSHARTKKIKADINRQKCHNGNLQHDLEREGLAMIVRLCEGVEDDLDNFDSFVEGEPATFEAELAARVR